MILVTSPNGKTGLSLIKKLQLQKYPFKVFTSSVSSESILSNHGVKNIFLGDLKNLMDVKLALKGTTSTYLITPNFFPDESSVIKNFISVCSKIRNYKIILHSVIHPQIKKLPHHWSRMQVEQKLITSGLNWVILQPTMYMQNILPQLKNLNLKKFIGMPIPIDKKLSMVDLEDVTDVALNAIEESKLDYGIYELAGYNLSLNDQARIISKIIKELIVAKQFSIDEAKSYLKIPFSGEYGERTYETMFNHYSRFGLDGNSTVLKSLLKRKPTNFSKVVKKYIENNNINL